MKHRASVHAVCVLYLIQNCIFTAIVRNILHFYMATLLFATIVLKILGTPNLIGHFTNNTELKKLHLFWFGKYSFEETRILPGLYKLTMSFCLS